MSMFCPHCHSNGSMRKCTKCGYTWCGACSSKGKWPGLPKYTTSNICPMKCHGKIIYVG